MSLGHVTCLLSPLSLHLSTLHQPHFQHTTPIEYVCYKHLYNTLIMQVLCESFLRKILSLTDTCMQTFRPSKDSHYTVKGSCLNSTTPVCFLHSAILKDKYNYFSNPQMTMVSHIYSPTLRGNDAFRLSKLCLNMAPCSACVKNFDFSLKVCKQRVCM